MTNLDSVLKSASSLEENYDQPRYHIKKQRHYFANKRLSSQNYGFPVVMYGCELNHKESWAAEELMLLNCDVGEDSWESLGQQGDQTSQS